MSRAVIVGYLRSPFTLAHKGQLAGTRPDDLAADVIKALIAKTGVKAEDVEDVILGCAFPEGEQGFNMARMVGLLAGLPITTGGLTVNRWCGSSMEAIHIAAGNIASGKGELFVAAGLVQFHHIHILDGKARAFERFLRSRNRAQAH
jgi:acetyl-CoA acyltransferase